MISFVRRYLGFLAVLGVLAGAGGVQALTPAQQTVLFVGCQQAARGADQLLCGEPAGLAIDFTGNSGLGQVSVKGHTTNYSNVAVDDWPLSQSGTSPKLVLWSDGNYRWSPHNLILRSQELDNASWTKSQATITANAATAPDGTLTADKIVEAAASAEHYAKSSGVTSVVGRQQTSSVYLKAAERTWARLYLYGYNNYIVYVNLSNGATGTTSGGTSPTLTVTDAGNGWYRVAVSDIITATPEMYIATATGNGGVNYLGDGASGIYAWGAAVNLGLTALTYRATTSAAWFGVPIEYDPATGKFYLLVEPQATNLALRASEFDNVAWVYTASGTGTGNAPSVTANQAVAPDGSLTADLITIPARSASTRLQELYQLFTGTAVAYTGSVFVKAETAGDVGKTIEIGLWNATAFVAPISVTLTASWQRVQTSGTLAASANCAIAFGRFGSGVTTDLSAVGFYIWQAQPELGSVATSPIPTFGGATVTRAVDNINVATSAFPFAADGPNSVRLRAAGSPVTNGRLFAFSDGSTSNNRVLAYRPTGNNQTLFNVRTGSSEQLGSFLVDSTALDGSTRHTWAFRWATNDANAASDGVVKTADTSVTLPSAGAMTRLDIGTEGSAGLPGNWRIESLVFVPRAWSDAELQSKTVTALDFLKLPIFANDNWLTETLRRAG